MDLPTMQMLPYNKGALTRHVKDGSHGTAGRSLLRAWALAAASTTHLVHNGATP